MSNNSSNDCESSADDGSETKSKKRTRNVANWKNSKVKLARLAGEAYTTSTSGKPIQAKETGPPCQ